MQVAADANTNLYYQFHNTRKTGNHDSYPSGNIRLSRSLAKSLEVYVGAGTTGRMPNAAERYFSRSTSSGVTVGDPLLPITRNSEVAAGMNLSQSRFYLRPELFYSDLNNYIVVNNQPLLNAGSAAVSNARSYTNIDARIYGGEMAGGVTLTRELSLASGVSYSRGSASRKPDANVLSSNLPETPPLRAWGALRYAHRWAYAEFGGTAVNHQGRVDTDLNETPTPGYGLLNFKLGFTHRKLSGSFTMDNLLNHFYYENFSYYRDPFSAGVKIPEPGRNFFVQLRYSF